jgi:hypothetical protein
MLPEASDLYRCSDSGNCRAQYALERERERGERERILDTIKAENLYVDSMSTKEK